MEILNSLGFDPVILVAQVVNFLIILYLLKRFMYKPVLDMLKKRQDSISEGLKQADQARVALENAIAQEKKILEKAKLEALDIVNDAKIRSIEIAAKMQEDAKIQTENIIIQTKNQLEQEGKELEKRLVEKVGILAEDMVKKSLEGIFTEREQKQITQKAIKQIKKAN